MGVRREFQRLPGQLQSVVKTIQVLGVWNPDDARWEKVYGIPGFRSFATGGRSSQLRGNGRLGAAGRDPPPSGRSYEKQPTTRTMRWDPR